MFSFSAYIHLVDLYRFVITIVVLSITLRETFIDLKQSGRRVPGSVHFPDEADFPFPTFCEKWFVVVEAEREMVSSADC